jgi:DNA-binding NarL/FixJ family response regulator
MLDHFANPPVPAAADDPFPELTAREREVLALLAGGRRTAEIAEALHLSPKTISNNLTTIFAKLEVADRTAAVIRARERGLGG